MRGSPIRTPSDQRSVGSSPRLIAASHVLHRLLVPRHPPCALNNLTNTQQHMPRRRAPTGSNRSRAARHRQDARVHCAVLNDQTATTPRAPPTPILTGCRRYGTGLALPETPAPTPEKPPRAGPAPSGPNSVPTHPRPAPAQLHTPRNGGAVLGAGRAAGDPNWSAFHPRAPAGRPGTPTTGAPPSWHGPAPAHPGGRAGVAAP